MEFFVAGIPVPKGSAKAFVIKGTNRAIVTQTNRDKQKPWASLISFEAQRAREKGSEGIITGPVQLRLTFFMPRPRSHFGTGKNAEVMKASAPLAHTSKPDLDKLVRCVKDALTAVIWNDDSQVCYVEAMKVYDCTPGVMIVVDHRRM